MSIFHYAPNTATTELISGVEPWDFQVTENITDQIRKVKEDRQSWYRNVDTKHCFYTGIEPLNPHLRPNKTNNPPQFLRALPADFDINCPRETILKAIEQMPLKPSWLERSLGGNFRLIYIFEEPLRISDVKLCIFLLQRAVGWLKLGLLPCLDEGAFTDPTRLLCRGTEPWENLGHGPISVKEVQYFFMEAAREYRFKPTESDAIPLDVVEKALKEKYPAFEWPVDFELNSQGPSHWYVPGSTSPLSSIVKQGGMSCFSAHAEKDYYTWADLLGADFVKGYLATAYTAATKDCWWDGHDFWMMEHGRYHSVSESNFRLYLRVDCGLSNKPGPDGISPMDKAIRHVQRENLVSNAASFTFRPPGLVIYQNERRLNIYPSKPIEPATGTQKWGPHGEFPFFSAVVGSNLLVDPDEQLQWWLAWVQYAYQAAYEHIPLPGHLMSMCGGKDCGKTLINREFIGTLLGGFTDAREFLVKGKNFNDHLTERPHWVIDDEIPASTPGGRQMAANMFKTVIKNSGMMNEAKYKKAGMGDFCGRLGMTLNLDFTSMRLLTGSLDNNSLDALCLFRCADTPSIKFPHRMEILKMRDKELPYIARFLLDMKWSDEVEAARNSRFGFNAYHNKWLLERSLQGSPVAPFRELLIDTLKMYAADNPEAVNWTGTVTALIRLMNSNGLNVELMRKYDTDKVNRYLEQIHAERLMDCSVGTSADKTRVWTFARIEPDFTNKTSKGVSFESTGPIPSEIK